ncbi:MAG: ISL3 family transposase [Lachnospiraceae bacterium]|nr:ISL3 family transposase [Lachnospiraceae bacterium]
MYDIGIPEINITARSESDDGRAILYTAEAAHRPICCANPACGHKVKPHVHSSKTNLIHDIRSEGKLVYINLTIHRYRCPDCSYVFPDEFTFFAKNSHITDRLKQEFVDRCIKGETFTYIGNDYSVDHKTVAAAFKAYSDTHKELLTYDYTPEVLGLDEAHIDDHFRLVITDIKEQRLLDMKRDNKAPTVKAYLHTLDKSTCKCVTMDFAPAYAKCVKTVLPDALIVIDKFHAIQEVNRCLDRTRISLQNYYSKTEGFSTKLFKRAKYLFMTNWENLTESEWDALNGWFNRFPDLFTAYMTKETFRDIYNLAKDRTEADSMFDEWLKTIPDFKAFEPMRKTMIKRRGHILNYWDAPYTNAYTESVNNLIKKIEKAGRGYKFDTLRERCMLEINTEKPDKFNPRKATFVNSDGSAQTLTEKAGKLYLSAVPKKTTKTINVDSVLLKDSLMLYFKHFDRTKHAESTIARISAYAEAIQRLAH